MTNETDSPTTNSWTELRWWLLAATNGTIVLLVCQTFLGTRGLVGAVAYVLSFVAEAFIQFRAWWRRLVWIFSGILCYPLIFHFPAFRPFEESLYVHELPVWIREPVTFLLPAILELTAASGARKHAWIWLLITPALFGLRTYWMPLATSIVDNVSTFIQAQGVVTGGETFQLYAAFFGTIFFTRALVGSFIASRKLAQ